MSGEPFTTLAVPQHLIDVRSGEMLPATPENAAELIRAARDLRNHLMALVHDCEAVLLEESRRLGTKTIHLPAGKAVVSGGPESGVEWDTSVLARLIALGLPDERWHELASPRITYKVSAAVAKQLEAANPAYAEIIREARVLVDKPYRVYIQ